MEEYDDHACSRGMESVRGGNPFIDRQRRSQIRLSLSLKPLKPRDWFEGRITSAKENHEKKGREINWG